MTRGAATVLVALPMLASCVAAALGAPPGLPSDGLAVTPATVIDGAARSARGTFDHHALAPH